MKAGKVWGVTELIEGNNALEFHRIEMQKGGVCSKHLHRYKWNGFLVESGKINVKVWQREYDLVDETILGPGMYTKVKPGLYHQFEVLETGVAFELYWAEFNHNDILRESTGYYDIESLVDKDEGTNDIIIRVSDDKIDDWDDTGNYGEGC
tara:strand:+ start:32 stop:484 length:453 start_codon:yes stop_codon:yes gene_type:complete